MRRFNAGSRPDRSTSRCAAELIVPTSRYRTARHDIHHREDEFAVCVPGGEDHTVCLILQPWKPDPAM